MKKILFILVSLVSMLCVSCGNDNSFVDEPEISNVQECAVTYIESQLLNNNHIQYICPVYYEQGFWVKIPQYDSEFLIDPNVNSNIPNLIGNYSTGLSYVDKLKRLIENDFHIKLTYDGYTNGLSFNENIFKEDWREWPNGTEIRYNMYSYYMYGDKIEIYTNPRVNSNFVTIQIICVHGHHNNARLKDAKVLS